MLYLTALPILSIGLPAGVVYFVVREPRPVQLGIITAVGAALAIAGLLTGLAGLLVAPAFTDPGGAVDFRRLMRLFVWYPVLTFPITFLDGVLVAVRRPYGAALLATGSSLLQLLCITVPVLAGLDLSTAIIILSVGAAVRLLVVGAYVRHIYRDVVPVMSGAMLRELFSYSWPLGMSSILGILTTQVDRIFIALFFAAEAYAVYANGAFELPLVGVVSGAVATVLLPEFVRLFADGKVEKLRAMWHRSIVKVAMLFFPLTAFFFLFAHDTIVVLFSSKYADSAAIFQVAILTLPVRVTTYGLVLRAANATGIILIAAGVAFALKAVSAYFLIKSIGLVGGALSTLLALYLLALVQLWKCRKVLGAGWGGIFPWADLARVAAASVVAAGIGRLVALLLGSPLHRLLVGGLAFTVVCVACYVAIPSTRRALSDVWEALFVRHSIRHALDPGR